jgi:hypothetical protein
MMNYEFINDANYDEASMDELWLNEELEMHKRREQSFSRSRSHHRRTSNIATNDERVCYPAVEGDMDLDLDLDDNDDDCCWEVPPVPIANGAELDGEERSRVCSDLVLPLADQGQDTSPSVQSCTSCTSPRCRGCRQHQCRAHWHHLHHC